MLLLLLIVFILNEFQSAFNTPWRRKVSEVSEGIGRCWKVSVGVGRCRKVSEGIGRCRKVSERIE